MGEEKNLKSRKILFIDIILFIICISCNVFNFVEVGIFLFISGLLFFIETSYIALFGEYRLSLKFEKRKTKKSATKPKKKDNY